MVVTKQLNIKTELIFFTMFFLKIRQKKHHWVLIFIILIMLQKVDPKKKV